MSFNAVLALFMGLIGLPATVFGFILLLRRDRHRIESLRLQKEILALEVEKERLRACALAEENRKYDRLIEGGGDAGRRP